MSHTYTVGAYGVFAVIHVFQVPFDEPPLRYTFIFPFSLIYFYFISFLCIYRVMMYNVCTHMYGGDVCFRMVNMILFFVL